MPGAARLPRQGQGAAAFAPLTRTTDLAPTFRELARTEPPGPRYKGRDVAPISGRSMMAGLGGSAQLVHPAGSVFADELYGRRYVRRDQWKLLWMDPPSGSGRWELYDLASDRAENRDVQRAYPSIAHELRKEWDLYARRVGVVLPLIPGSPVQY